MPPKAVKTIRELIYWVYAEQVIAPSAGFAKNYRFIMSRYQKLKNGEMADSAAPVAVGSTREMEFSKNRFLITTSVGKFFPYNFEWLLASARGATRRKYQMNHGSILSAAKYRS